jgi:hypothetical protein
VTTAILLNAPADRAVFWSDHAGDISEKLEAGFFWGEIKRIIGEAIKVDGVERALAALTTAGTVDVSDEHIRKLRLLDDSSPETGALVGDPKWKRIFAATGDNGCALILPARSRIKIIAGGAQIAEYRHGKWTYAPLGALKEKLSELTTASGIALELLTHIVQMALVASDMHSGRTFVVEQKDGVLPRLVPGYKDIVESDGVSELKLRTVNGFEPLDYLKLIEGDGAVIISSEGKTLAINAKLAPAPDTQVSEIVSAGTRHLSAQKITKESATVAVVVSDDGPVTIFFQGRPFYRKL